MQLAHAARIARNHLPQVFSEDQHLKDRFCIYFLRPRTFLNCFALYVIE